MHSRFVRTLVVIAAGTFVACSTARDPMQPSDGLDASWDADATSSPDARPMEGARIAIAPHRLDFDSMAPRSPRRLTIANVGAAPLKIGKFGATGAWIPGAPELAGDAPDAFSVDWPPAGYGDQAGIAPGAVLEVVVHADVAEGAEASALLRVPSNDAENSTVELSLRAAPVHVPSSPCTFDVVPPRLAFGVVEPGREAHATLTIRNLSSNPDAVCVVGSVEMQLGSHPAISIPNPPPPGTVIPAAGHLDFQVRYLSTAEAKVQGTVVVRMENAAQPVTVQVGGESVGPGCLMIAPSEVNFSPVQVGCGSRETTITVYNVCPVAQQIDAIALSPADAGFRLTRSVAVPSVLVPGGQLALGVTYRPTAIGESSASLQISAGELDGGAGVVLTGRAYVTPEQKDVFAQEEPWRVDVLLVVDNSVSMAGQQQKIASEVRSMMDFYESECIDYQIAVTTTEVDAAHGGSGTMPDAANGRFLPLDGSSPRVVTPAMADRHQLIAQRLQLGFTSTAPEYLIRPAVLGLTPPLSTAENAGFLRSNASLSVLLLTDTADHDTAPVAGYVSTLQALKTRPSGFWFSAVAPTLATPPATCSYGEPGAGSSTRVRDMVQATGGGLIEVCEQRWLSFLGWGRCAGVNRTRFYLSSPPAGPQAIQVTVDGVSLPMTAPSGGVNWTFDGRSNALELASPALFPPGTTMVVTYAVGCLP